MRHLTMGGKQASLTCGESPGGIWERRTAEQAERTAAAMEDPVSRFYLRHGLPAPWKGPEGAAAGTEDEEPSAG